MQFFEVRQLVLNNQLVSLGEIVNDQPAAFEEQVFHEVLAIDDCRPVLVEFVEYPSIFERQVALSWEVLNGKVD